MTALAQTIERDVSVPGWVPPEFRAIYRLVAATRGEEAAAALARKLKAADGESGWTSGRLATLVGMWADGRSAAQISDAIGGGITRAAVIGKLHRLHLADDMRGRSTRSTRPITARAQVVRLPVILSTSPAPIAASKPAPPPPAPKAIAPPPAPLPTGGVGIFELRDHHCRWIISGAGVEAHFCGAKRVPDAKRWFCAGHEAEAMDTSGRRRS